LRGRLPGPAASTRSSTAPAVALRRTSRSLIPRPRRPPGPFFMPIVSSATLGSALDPAL
jgi:hypothetical protein